MLISLSVKNLALIENAEVSFGKGLNVFSGETGAGKSLVIGAVSLALGARAKGDLARDENAPAEIELVFSAEEEEERELYRELGVPVEEDGLIIIRRQISDGRNITKINGRTVTLSELKAVSTALIDIHGQSEHQSLLYEKNHLKLLDRFAGEEDGKALFSYMEKYDRWSELNRELSEAEPDEGLRKREADLIAYEIKEIEEADLRDGEDTELEDRFRLINNSKKIAEAVNEAYGAVSSDEGAASGVARALRAMSGVTGMDEGAEGLYNQLNDIESLIGDLTKDMSSYISELDFSDEEFENVTSRLDLINNLKMKYGKTIPEIIKACDERREKLDVLEHYDEHLNRLKADEKEAYEVLKKAAKALSDVRNKAAGTLGDRVATELKELNFADSRFKVTVDPLEKYGPDGGDRVSFIISTNPGEEMKPIKDVASGGELSRIMLSLKSVFADTDDIETMIFDEIDTGISGQTAQKVSESLLRLSRRHQVVLITHLPQIAAMADQHYLIEKTVENGRTRTDIESLDREGMVRELARMLSGASLTDTVTNNAREMKELADKKKAQKERKTP